MDKEVSGQGQQEEEAPTTPTESGQQAAEVLKARQQSEPGYDSQAGSPPIPPLPELKIKQYRTRFSREGLINFERIGRDNIKAFLRGLAESHREKADAIESLDPDGVKAVLDELNQEVKRESQLPEPKIGDVTGQEGLPKPSTPTDEPANSE